MTRKAGAPHLQFLNCPQLCWLLLDAIGLANTDNGTLWETADHVLYATWLVQLPLYYRIICIVNSFVSADRRATARTTTSLSHAAIRKKSTKTPLQKHNQGQSERNRVKETEWTEQSERPEWKKQNHQKKHHHKNTTTPQHHHTNTTTKTPPHKHYQTTTKTPQKHHYKTPPQKHHHKNTTTKTPPQKQDPNWEHSFGSRLKGSWSSEVGHEGFKPLQAPLSTLQDEAFGSPLQASFKLKASSRLQAPLEAPWRWSLLQALFKPPRSPVQRLKPPSSPLEAPFNAEGLKPPSSPRGEAPFNPPLKDKGVVLELVRNFKDVLRSWLWRRNLVQWLRSYECIGCQHLFHGNLFERP